jgi:hypothetical protein
MIGIVIGITSTASSEQLLSLTKKQILSITLLSSAIIHYYAFEQLNFHIADDGTNKVFRGTCPKTFGVMRTFILSMLIGDLYCRNAIAK